MPITPLRPWRQPHHGKLLALLVAALAAVFLWQVILLVTEWFWFTEVGYTHVFRISLLTRAGAGLVLGVVFFLLTWGNLKIALHVTARMGRTPPEAVMPLPLPQFEGVRLQRTVIVLCLVMVFFAGLRGTAQGWSLLLFAHGVPFGIKDPLLGRDIGFYVFRLPLLQYLYDWLMGVLILTLALTAAVYLLRRSFFLIPPRTVRVLPAARTHLMLLVAALFLIAGFGFWLDLSELLFVKRGVVFGPGYTDATTQIWVLWSLIVLSVLTALSFLGYLYGRRWRLPALAVLVFVAAALIGRTLYPSFVQRFKVIPNEITLERPYLERNIAYTRQAYGLEQIEAREFPADNRLSMEDIRRNELTIRNIRLWDYAPLLRTYSQLQEIRTYYKFLDVDNDRYLIDDAYRQVMIAPRELSYQALPSRTWVNEHLTYTHGYGVVVSPVNRISSEGLPEFFVKDIPPVAMTSLKVNRPEIYFGEADNDYVFVHTKRPEFDYPVGDRNVYVRYEGRGGVPLSMARKILFALRFQSLTTLLSDDITSNSRIMYYRSVKERVRRIAPFLRLDADPFLVISDEGRLFWLLDAYTVSDRYPYSEPTPQLGNYVRNSVKAVVDAYHGTVWFYVSDPQDPIIRTWSRIFPTLFQPLARMPESLRRHVRYPGSLLAIQAHMYRAYHMQDPQVFYNKEDLWTIPSTMAGREGEQEMEPYYTIMKLPDGQAEEYILLLPFTPTQKDNMSAWMAARCDSPNYGHIVVYNFPKQRLVYGPRQVTARINQDAVISQQLSLWNQRGSQVIHGSLLAIPIEKSILYVQPLYLAAEQGQLPELKRVIVAFGNTIAMDETLDQALVQIFGAGAGAGKAIGRAKPVAAGPMGPRSVTADTRAAEALSHFRKAQEYLRQGNWTGFGEELRLLGNTLEAMVGATDRRSTTRH